MQGYKLCDKSSGFSEFYYFFSFNASICFAIVGVTSWKLCKLFCIFFLSLPIDSWLQLIDYVLKSFN